MTAKAKQKVELVAPEIDESPAEIPEGPVTIGKAGKTGAELAPAKRHDLFSINDVMYTMPEPTIGHVLKYVRVLRKSGDRLIAAETIGFDLLGDEALDALAASPDASEDDIAAVFAKVGAIFFGSSAYKKIMASAGNS